MSKSTVTSKGQTTIPRSVRETLGIRRGDVLEWEIRQQHVRLRRVGRGFLSRRGIIHTGPGSITADIDRARKSRGSTRP